MNKETFRTCKMYWLTIILYQGLQDKENCIAKIKVSDIQAEKLIEAIQKQRSITLIPNDYEEAIVDYEELYIPAGLPLGYLLQMEQ